MGRTCCVRKICDCDPNLTKHGFPMNDKIKDLWLSKIPLGRSDTQYLCSAHFNESAYKMESCDTNASRHNKNSAKLKRKVLKPDAVPEIFLNMPSYYSKIDPPKRASLNSSGLRLIQDDEKRAYSTESEEKGQVNESYSFGLNTLKCDLDESIFPSHVCITWEEARLTLVSIKYSSDDGQPVLRYSIVITDSLCCKIWINGLELPKDKLPSFLINDHVKSATQLIQLVEYLENSPEINTDDTDIIQIVLKNLEQLNSTDKVEFLKEQIS